MPRKLNPMKKNGVVPLMAIVGIILIFAMSPVSAQQELKLMCNLRLSKTYMSGNQEQLSVRSILQVNNYGDHLSIIPDGDELAVVSTFPMLNKSTENFSDKNKWDLVSTTVREGRRAVTRISIDRNTGRIVYSRDWNDSAIVTSGEGFCEKVDLSVRKF